MSCTKEKTSNKGLDAKLSTATKEKMQNEKHEKPVKNPLMACKTKC